MANARWGTVIIGARVERFGDVLLVRAAGQEQDRLFEASDLADMVKYLNSRHARNSPIEHKQINRVTANGSHHVFPVGEDGDFMAGFFQDFAHMLCEVCFIFEQGYIHK